MPTPSGQIGLSDVNLELSKSATALITLNDTDVRNLAQKPGSGNIISMNDLRGKSATFSVSISSNVAVLAIGQTATITFVTNEVSYDFSSTVVSVSAGTLSTLTTSDYKTFTGTYTPPTNSTGTVSISVSANTFTNGITGAYNTASNTVQINYDTLQPTMSITAGSTSLGLGQTTTVTFTSSESTNNFALADITVSSGTLSSFSGSGTTYTATYTPPTNTNSSANISVAAGKFSDSFGNTNPASNTLTISYNTLPAPTYSLTRNVTSVNEGGSVTYTVTTTNFGTGTLYWTQVTGTALAGANDMSDLVAEGSVSITNNSGSFIRTLRNDLLTEGTETLRVQLRTGSTSGTVVATAGDVSIGDTSTAPTVSVMPTTISNGTVGTFYTKTFYVTVNNVTTPATFSYSGTLPPGLSFSNNEAAGSGYFYDAVLEGTASSGGEISYTITVFATTNSGYSASRSYTWTMYNPPTMTISTNNANLAVGQTAQLTFQTNTGAYGFTQSDISVSAGSISNFSGSNGSTSFTATYTPPTNSSGTATISVPAGAFQNNLGGNSAASNNLQISYSTIVPTVYNPLSNIHNQTITGTAFDTADMYVGLVFNKNGTYNIYKNGVASTFDWINVKTSTSGVGKYVRFVLQPGYSFSATGGYGSSPSNLASLGGTSGWMQILTDPPGSTLSTDNATFVFVAETSNNYGYTQSSMTILVQISTSATGSPIVSQTTVTLVAGHSMDAGGA